MVPLSWQKNQTKAEGNRKKQESNQPYTVYFYAGTNLVYTLLSKQVKKYVNLCN